MQSSDISIFTKTDSYKLGHPAMYPDAKKMVAYGEFRKHFHGSDDERIVFYGIRNLVDKYLNRRWTEEDLDSAKEFFATHNVAGTAYPFPEDLFLSFIKENDGYFPVKVEAMPEGSVITPGIPVYQITAEGKYARLVTFLETVFTHIWYSCTVATLSRHAKELISKAFDETVDDDSRWLLNSRLHDFGYRGCTTDEQAMIGGSAHLLNFDGTDTMVAAAYAHMLNNGKPFATSIPATEHSVMTSWPSELAAVENMIDKFGHSVFACVADSYDYQNFLDTILPAVANKVKAKGGTMVVRPDSGNAIDCVIAGLNACATHFGYTVNKKGYKVLNNSAVIQGDGIDIKTIKWILHHAKAHRFSAQNIAFGMGAGLLQKVNRDTMSFATKLNYIQYADGTGRDIMKSPKTDTSKYSLPGILKVIKVNGQLMAGTLDDTEDNILEVVYDNGPEKKEWPTFDEMRKRIDSEWAKMPTKRTTSMSAKLKKKVEKILQSR